MSAQVLPLLAWQANMVEAARQEYDLAVAHYREAARRYDVNCRDAVDRFHDARYRRHAAFDRYVGLLRGESDV